MTDKNKPLRSIDQKTLSTTPPPTTRPKKFNPYTGGIIKGEEQSRYQVFLESDEDWTLSTFNLRVNSTSLLEDRFSVRVPQLIIRIFNPNFAVDRLKIYLAFSREAFYQDDSVTDSLRMTEDPGTNLKIISFDTRTVQSINSNTAVRNISSRVVELMRKHTVNELLALMYPRMTQAAIETLSNSERISRFNEGLDDLKVFAQVAFTPLNPISDLDRTPYILRSPISCAYKLTPDLLRSADISSTSLTIDNISLNFNFSQVSIQSINYNVRDNLNRVVAPNTKYTIPIVNNTSEKNQTIRVDISSYAKLENKFNVYASPISSGVLNSLLSASFSFTLSLTSVTTTTLFTRNGAQITEQFDIPITYTQTYGANVNYTESFTADPIVLDLINGSRIFKVGVPIGSSTTGVLLAYRLANNTFIPRYYKLTNPERVGSFDVYTIVDFMTNSRSTNNTFKQSTNNALDVTAYPVNNFGRCSLNAVIYPSIAQQVNLTKDLQNNNNGYYRQCISLDGTRTLRFTQGTRRDANLRLAIPFRVVSQIKNKGLWQTVFTSELYRATVVFQGRQRYIKFLKSDNTELTGVPLNRFLGDAGYRILLEPDTTALTKYQGTYTFTSFTTLGILEGK